MSTKAQELRRVDDARRAKERSRQAAALAAARLDASVVRAARVGATQREIARRAGVSQPYVSRLVNEATGRFVPSSRLGLLVAAHRREIKEVVGRHGGGRVCVFGSVARGEDGPTSDIDLLIEAPDELGLLGLARLEHELRALLGVSVDVVPARLIKDEVRLSSELVPL